VIRNRKGIVNYILKSLFIRLINSREKVSKLNEQDSLGLFSLIDSRLNYSLHSFVKNWKSIKIYDSFFNGDSIVVYHLKEWSYSYCLIYNWMWHKFKTIFRSLASERESFSHFAFCRCRWAKWTIKKQLSHKAISYKNIIFHVLFGQVESNAYPIRGLVHSSRNHHQILDWQNSDRMWNND